VEVQKHVVLSPAMSLQHLQDSWLEVVIDRHARHTSPELESVSLTEQKGFLSLGGETFHKHRPRKAEPSGQERDFHQLAFELDCRFAKVTFCSLAWCKVERNIRWFRAVAQLLHKQAHG
jgi:hypothetical protein